VSEYAPGSQPLVIAHRGASGYLPEHTLAAKAMAHAMEADFLEQDVVLTGDGVPVVHHDLYLEHTTDVAQRFPERRRRDGHWYVLDFSLQELRTLQVFERSSALASDGPPVFSRRFPAGVGLFGIPTLAEELRLTRGLNASRGRNTGVYIELKSPAWHMEQGRDPAMAVLQVLGQEHFLEDGERVFLQCFETATLQRLRHRLNVQLPLIQLLERSHAQMLRDPAALADIAGYAEGIGPAISMIYRGMDAEGKPEFTSLVKEAHRAGLLVHPYTFRRDRLPPGVDDFETLLRLFTERVKVDGFFTDFPDLVRDFLGRRQQTA